MIAIISDVHGNYPALMAVLSEIDKMDCKQIISLGDVSGYYCMVNECIEEFRRRNIVNLLGNHDYYILGRGDCPRSYTVNKITEYQRKIITPENKVYLEKSLIELDNDLLSAPHGGWNDPIDEYITDFDFECVKDKKVNIFCSGHTHVQKMVMDGDRIYFNPGSVGQPRDFDSRAAFAIIDDDKEIYLHRIQYDIDQIVDAMKQANQDERIWQNLYYGKRIGE